MAKLTTAYTSDGLGNLRDLCEKYKLDKLVAEPDFTLPHGYYITGFLGDKFATVRINPSTDKPATHVIDHVVEKLAASLREDQ